MRHGTNNREPKGTLVLEYHHLVIRVDINAGALAQAARLGRGTRDTPSDIFLHAPTGTHPPRSMPPKGTANLPREQIWVTPINYAPPPRKGDTQGKEKPRWGEPSMAYPNNHMPRGGLKLLGRECWENQRDGLHGQPLRQYQRRPSTTTRPTGPLHSPGRHVRRPPHFGHQPLQPHHQHLDSLWHRLPPAGILHVAPACP